MALLPINFAAADAAHRAFLERLYSIDFWAQHIDGLEEQREQYGGKHSGSSEWLGHCPNTPEHPDVHPSFVIGEAPDDPARPYWFHCRVCDPPTIWRVLCRIVAASLGQDPDDDGWPEMPVPPEHVCGRPELREPAEAAQRRARLDTMSPEERDAEMHALETADPAFYKELGPIPVQGHERGSFPARWSNEEWSRFLALRGKWLHEWRVATGQEPLPDGILSFEPVTAPGETPPGGSNGAHGSHGSDRNGNDAGETPHEEPPPTPDDPYAGPQWRYRRGYAAYLGVTVAFVAQQPIAEDPAHGGIARIWPEIDRQKYRKIHPGRHRPKGDKSIFGWTPDEDDVRPEVWPSLPPTLPDEVWLVEGESDRDVAAYWGYTCFCITAGAGTIPPQRTFDEIKRRGAQRVVLPFNLDTGGEKFRKAAMERCRAAGLVPVPLDISPLLDPVFGWQNDLRDLQISGLVTSPEEAQEKLGPLVEASRTVQQRKRAVALTPAQVIALPRPAPVVVGYLMRDSLAQILGNPGRRKTFIALDLVLSVTTGTPWCGKEVKAGTALYIAGEGVGGLGVRMQAWSRARGQDLDEARLLVIPQARVLRDAADVADVLEQARTLPEEPSLIVVDTLSRCFGDGNENHPDAMQQFINGMDALREATSACVLVLHHGTKADARISRGHGSLLGALDTQILVEQSGERLTLTCGKQKNADDFAPFHLQQRKVLWDAPDGTPLDSLVFDPSAAPASNGASGTTAGSSNRGESVTLPTMRQKHETMLAILAQHPQGLRSGEWEKLCADVAIGRSAFHDGRKDLLALERVVKRITAAGEIYTVVPATPGARTFGRFVGRSRRRR